MDTLARRPWWASFAFVASLLIISVSADTPANCTYEDVQGTWTLYETDRTSDSSIDCSEIREFPNANKVELQLLSPNVAVDQYGNKGHWTMIYNQGFEITVNGRVYFAFSKYEQKGSEVVSHCDQTLSGWSHDVLAHNWACFSGKHQSPRGPKVHSQPKLLKLGSFVNKHSLISALNSKQKKWQAKAYDWMENMSHGDLLKMRGGVKSKIHSRPPVAAVSSFVRRQAEFLPESWDWRNVSGVNYVPDVRNQGSCGSCYAFSSMAMIESRIRVATKNQVQVSLSPQDIVSCSSYSQGCDGGFPYLVAGKYAQDHGVVPEECNPYQGKDSTCSTKKCPRKYVSKYRYVGGYYGACNEELMKLSLVQGGPLSVSFEVYPDFMHYSGGVYSRSDNGLLKKFDPFELTNHAVLLVGYGSDEKTKEKYWIVKNSWGTKWGENGYFRIRRGTDECGIESIAVEVTPIP